VEWVLLIAKCQHGCNGSRPIFFKVLGPNFLNFLS
jgi:hypothetical protein